MKQLFLHINKLKQGLLGMFHVSIGEHKQNSKIKTILLTLVCFFSIQLFYAQEDDGVVSFNLPVRNSFKFNRYVINPTFSFVREQNNYISAYNKREWAQFDDAPQTYLLGYSGRFAENIGAGIGLFQQNYGVLTTFGGILNFAYNARLKHDSNLTFGLNLGIYKSGLNTGKVVTNFSDPSLDNIPSNLLLTVNPGINYGTQFLDFGVSINNLVLYNVQSSALIQDDPHQTLQAHVMYTGYMNGRGFFDQAKFSGLLRSEFGKEATTVSGIVMLMSPKGIWGQLGFNSLYGASAGLGLNITEQIAIEYNFEKAMGDLTNFGPSHDITLAFTFNNRKNYKYGEDDEVSSIFSSGNKRVLASNEPKMDAETRAQLKAESEARRDEIRERAQNKAETRNQLAAEAKAKTAAENKAKQEEQARNTAIAQEKAKEKQAAIALVLAETRAQKAKEAQEKLDAQNKLRADARAKAEAQAKLAKEAQAKADQIAKKKYPALERANAEARAKALAEVELADEAKIKADQQAKDKLVVQEKAKAEAEAKLAATAKAKADQEAKDKLVAQEKARLDAEAKLAATAKAKADQEAKVKLLAEEKARLETEATLALAAKAKADQDAKDKLAAQEKARVDAEAKLAAESKAKQEAEDLLAIEARAKIEADKAAKLAIDEKTKKQTEAEVAAIAVAKAKQDAEVQAKKDAENTAQAKKEAQEAAIGNPTDAIAISMKSIADMTETSKNIQDELLTKFNDLVASKEMDLKDLKEENDLSEQGIYKAPKAFKSITEENNKLQAVSTDLDNIIETNTKRIKELEGLYNDRLKIPTLENDEVNLYYQKSLKSLKSEQASAIQTRAQLTASLKKINEATEFERKRRIKRAAYNNEEDRFMQDRATLKLIKQNTALSPVPLKAEDFDFGEERGNNIQIIKNVDNVDNGYYAVVAVHSDIAKRDEFLTKAVAAGQSNIDFFYDVNTSKYFIYSRKLDGIEAASEVMKTKGNQSYNSKLSIIKIEN